MTTKKAPPKKGSKKTYKKTGEIETLGKNYDTAFHNDVLANNDLNKKRQAFRDAEEKRKVTLRTVTQAKDELNEAIRNKYA